MPNALAASSIQQGQELPKEPLHKLGSKLKDPLFARWIFDRGSDTPNMPEISIDALFLDIVVTWSECDDTCQAQGKACRSFEKLIGAGDEDTTLEKVQKAFIYAMGQKGYDAYANQLKARE